MSRFLIAALSTTAALALSTPAHAEPQHDTLGLVLAEYTSLAGSAGSSQRGQELLTRFSPSPAPAASSVATVNHVALEGWFSQNCKQALGRGCTTQEKADAVAWMLRSL